MTSTNTHTHKGGSQAQSGWWPVSWRSHQQSSVVSPQTFPNGSRFPSSLSSVLVLRSIHLLSLGLFFQEASRRPTRRSVTTMESAVRKKCSGWGGRRTLLLVNCMKNNWDCVDVTATSLCSLSRYSTLFVFQDVDTIYHSQDNREFNLLDFSHLDSRWHSLPTSDD